MKYKKYSILSHAITTIKVITPFLIIESIVLTHAIFSSPSLYHYGILLLATFVFGICFTVPLTTFSSYRKYLGPINEMTTSMDGIKEGGIDAVLDEKKLGSFIEIGKKINEATTSLRKSKFEMTKHIYSLQNLYKKSENDIQHVSQFISESQGILHQTKPNLLSISEKFSHIHDFVKTLETTSIDIGNQTQTILENVSYMQQFIAMNKKEIETTETYIKHLEQTVNEIEKVMNLFQHEVKEIFDCSMSISEIADTTKLVTLNASIESIKTGKEGRVFLVIADEIAKISDAINKTTREIVKETRMLLDDSKEIHHMILQEKETFQSVKTLFSEEKVKMDEIISYMETYMEQIDFVLTETTNKDPIISLTLERLEQGIEVFYSYQTKMLQVSESIQHIETSTKSFENNMKEIEHLFTRLEQTKK